MSELVQKLAHDLGVILSRNEWRVCTAESCTGGGIATAITDIAGASAWFHAGFVCYSDDMKSHVLGVKAATLQAHGAVSEEVVSEMLQGALKKSGSQCAIAVSGIAGPSGGSLKKPVGTVVIGVATSGLETKGAANTDQQNIETRLFHGDRLEIRSQAIVESFRAANALFSSAAKLSNTIKSTV